MIAKEEPYMDLLKEKSLEKSVEDVVEDDTCHTFDCTKRGDTLKNL